jgi:hypothetical protein
MSPLGALGAGLAGGALGSGVQSSFFRLTRRITPSPPQDGFQPPEPAQRGESELMTVARRFVDHMMQRGPLSERGKKRGAMAVHYAFGTAWGGLYGLTAGTFPRLAKLPSALGFGLLVWAVSDNVILPAFRVAGWPGAYPAKNHAYAAVAHIAYAAGVYAGYRAIENRNRSRAALRPRRLPLMLRRFAWSAPLLGAVARARKPVLRLANAL